MFQVLTVYTNSIGENAMLNENLKIFSEMKFNYLLIDTVIFFLASLSIMFFYFPSIALYYLLFWTFILQLYLYKENKKIVNERQALRNKKLEKIEEEYKEVINLCKIIRKNKNNYLSGSYNAI